MTDVLTDSQAERVHVRYVRKGIGGHVTSEHQAPHHAAARLIDADMTVRIERPLGALSADGYRIRQGDERFDYRNVRLVRGDLPWRYVGSTHEYVTRADGIDPTVEDLDAIAIDDHGDGGSKAEKFERDRSLLEAELQQDPDNARAAFYLAQTYRDLAGRDGDAALLELARDGYERRAEMGGWSEEVYCAWREAGTASARLDDWPRAVGAYMRAWEERPQRLEAVHDLAAGLLERGLRRAAHRFTSVAAAMEPLPLPDDILFVEPWIYEWGMLFQYSISAYWCGAPDRSVEACRRLLARPDLPDAHRRQTRSNLHYAVAALTEGVPSGRRAVRASVAPLRRWPHAGLATAAYATGRRAQSTSR